jgi:hypothetical protein
MACWPKQQKYHREKPLYGADNLEKYGLSPGQLANDSWAFYKESGALGSLLTDIIIDNEAQVKESDYKLAHVQVCFSNVPVIPANGLGNSFPYSCGSYRSEEPSLFVENVNVHFDAEKELLKNTFGSLKRVSTSFPKLSLSSMVLTRPASEKNPRAVKPIPEGGFDHYQWRRHWQ